MIFTASLARVYTGSEMKSAYVILFFFSHRQPPTSTLFPYTTLFRSLHAAGVAGFRHRRWRDGQGCADRKSTRLNSSHLGISYAVFCLKKKKSNWKGAQSRRTLV